MVLSIFTHHRAALLMHGETVLFNATVEKSVLRRRASRLLAMAGAPRRKPRELVLTDRRLLCVKHKSGRALQLTVELWLKSAERDTDSKTTIVSVEPKGEREFVVMTVTRWLSGVAHCSSHSTGNQILPLFDPKLVVDNDVATQNPRSHQSSGGLGCNRPECPACAHTCIRHRDVMVAPSFTDI